MPRFFLEFHSCPEIYFEESCGSATGYNYSVSDAADYLGEKIGGFEYLCTSDKWYSVGRLCLYQRYVYSKRIGEQSDTW